MFSIQAIIEGVGLLTIGALLYAHYKLHLKASQIIAILKSASDAANAQKK